MREKTEMIEVICPKCQRTEIIRLAKEEMPTCPVCDVRMVIREVLKEGISGRFNFKVHQINV